MLLPAFFVWSLHACAGFSYSEAFVFTLSPLPRAFWWTGANSAFLRVRSEGLFLGSDG